MTDDPDLPAWQRWHDPDEPIRVGVSACLLGAEVRFDGGHKRDPYLLDRLSKSVEWRPVCPELEMGLGIPRPVIHLRGGERGDELVVRGTGEDLTRRMRDYADPRVDELAGQGLDGFILKKDSPSCGMERVRVYPDASVPADRAMPKRTGQGLFVQALRARLPELPLEEEGRLRDAPLRERFIEALFCHNRWRVMEKRGLSRRALVAFHEAHKMLLMAHDEKLARELGRHVGEFGRVPDEEIFARYRAGFVAAFKRRATVAVTSTSSNISSAI